MNTPEEKDNAEIVHETMVNLPAWRWGSTTTFLPPPPVKKEEIEDPCCVRQRSNLPRPPPPRPPAPRGPPRPPIRNSSLAAEQDVVNTYVHHLHERHRLVYLVIETVTA